MQPRRRPGERPSAKKLIFFVTEDWYFVSHRLELARAAREAGYDVAVLTRVGTHQAGIEQAGIRVIPLRIHRTGRNPLRELRTLLQIIGVYRRERPDIVHHVALKPVLYGSIAAGAAGVPVVINALAGMGWLAPSADRVGGGVRAVRVAIGRALGGGTTIVQNAADENMVREMGVAGERVRLIAGAGVDLDRFSPAEEAPGRPMVVLPGRLLWTKGVGEFVAAAEQLLSQGVDARFILAGEPDELNPSAIPAARIREWVARGIVENPGWVPDMAALLARSHIVCLPSYREGLPKALLEAAAAGRAIVTTDVPGCRDVVRDGECGLLVPARDAAALASALRELLTDPELRRRLGAAARSRAEREFGLDRIIAETLHLYEQVSAGNGRRTSVG